jgi:hypothetical protein
VTIEAEFRCRGYFGFGGGVEIHRLAAAPPGAVGKSPLGVYCNRCPLSQGCWAEHRARVERLAPNACAELRQLVEELGSDAGVREMMRRHGVEPYINVMLGNLDDGVRVAAGDAPLDRGPWTLPYPFGDPS